MMTLNVKMTTLWDTAPCSLIKVNFYKTIRHNQKVGISILSSARTQNLNISNNDINLYLDMSCSHIKPEMHH